MSADAKQCLNCDQSEQELPLLTLQFQGGQIWMCPQCLPVLIHAPHKLAGKLPGAETMAGAQHKH